VQQLRAVYASGELCFSNALSDPADPAAFAARLDELARMEWVVFAKPPFGGPEQVLAYLGRYTHRVAIAPGPCRRLRATRRADLGVLAWLCSAG
jgi:hypothetical protein